MKERLLPVSGKRMVKILNKIGFETIRIKGSHFIMSDGLRIIVVPCHGNADLPTGTQKGIIRDAQVTIETFNRMAKD